jgi:hypothetical protein
VPRSSNISSVRLRRWRDELEHAERLLGAAREAQREDAVRRSVERSSGRPLLPFPRGGESAAAAGSATYAVKS